MIACAAHVVCRLVCPFCTLPCLCIATAPTSFALHSLVLAVTCVPVWLPRLSGPIGARGSGSHPHSWHSLGIAIHNFLVVSAPSSAPARRRAFRSSHADCVRHRSTSMDLAHTLAYGLHRVSACVVAHLMALMVGLHDFGFNCPCGFLHTLWLLARATHGVGIRRRTSHGPDGWVTCFRLRRSA